MLNVNNDALIVMCVVPDGLQTDYMAIRGLAWKLGQLGNYTMRVLL